jgi:L-lactate dehydrogenase
VAPENVHAYIIGEHGDSQVAVLSSARIAGVPIGEFCSDDGRPCDQIALQAIANETRLAGLEIIHAKGATYYGIGAALVRIVGAILRNEHAVLTLSSLVPPDMNLGELFLSLPVILNRDGVARVVPIPLSPSERQSLEQSATILKQYIATLPDLECVGAG